MRQILFIGIRTDGGGWIEGDYYKTWEHTCFKHFIMAHVKGKEGNVIYSHNKEVVFSSVGEFTNLPLDKNGNRIWEHDIMCLTNDGKPTAEIVRGFSGWCFKWINKTFKTVRNTEIEPVFENIHLFEVIGNINTNTPKP